MATDSAFNPRDQLFTNFPDPLLIEDDAGVILAANLAAARMLGVAPAELPGRNSADFLTTESVERISPLLHQLRAQSGNSKAGKSKAAGRLRIEAQYVAAGGSRTDVELQIILVPWQSGADSEKRGIQSDSAFLIVVRPLTAASTHFAAERELVSLRESVGRGPFGAPQALFHVSSQNAVTSFSYGSDPHAGELEWVSNLLLSPKLKFALDRAWGGEEVLLEPAWYWRFAAPSAANTSGALAAVAEEAQRAQEAENSGERQVWLRLAFWPLKHDHTVSAVLVQAADCTAQRIEEEQQALAAHARFVAMVTASIHHEINNQLSVILAQASAMRLAVPQGQLPPPHVGAIIDAAQDAVALLRRSAESLHHGPDADVDLNGIMADAAEVLRHLLPREISVRAELGLGLPRVHGDANLIRALVLLLGRQLQSRLSSGTLSLKTYRPEQVHPSLLQVAFSIEDTGSRPAGQRLTSGGADSPQLALARAIARYHRAQLEIIPSSHAYVIEVTLPGIEKAARPSKAPPGAAAAANPDDHFEGLSRTAGEGPRPRDEAPANAAPKTATKRILIADDEENFRTFMGWALTQHGFEVVLTANGQEAFERFQESPAKIDLAILDAYMPRMGGLEAYLRMQVLRPDLPVLFASGFVRGPSAETLIDGCPGPAHVLLKPFSADDLLAAVEAALTPPSDEVEAPPPAAKPQKK